jgi:hypothetical protein
MLSGCGGFDVEEMFSLHAAPANREDVRALRGGKVACLHCPLYFAFETDSVLTGKIISLNHLQPTTEVTPSIRQIVDLVSHEAAWWEMTNPTRQDKIFWAAYKTERPGLDPLAFRLLIVRGKQSFFVTSGYFDSADYVLINAA